MQNSQQKQVNDEIKTPFLTGKQRKWLYGMIWTALLITVITVGHRALTWELEEGYVGVFFEEGLVVRALPPGRHLHRPSLGDPIIITREHYDESIDFAVSLANYIRSVPGGIELNYTDIAEVLAAGFMAGMAEDMYGFVHSIIWDLTVTHSTQHLQGGYYDN